MKVILIITTIIGAVLMYSCESNTESISPIVESTQVDEKLTLQLLTQTCFTCHNPDLDIDNRVAPPLFKIREHYLDEETTKEDFVKDITHFIHNPTEENSIMPGAVRNFGIMPKMTFKEADIKSIAAYLYENDVASDEWYSRWEAFKKEDNLIIEVLSYEDKGLKLAMATKAVLGKNLIHTIKTKGTNEAVDFCTINAMPLIDSMSLVLNAKIKRVSDKPRNVKNAADKTEISFIEELKLKLLNNEKLTPKIIELEDKVLAYYAIETNQMCLQCHGNVKSDIDPSTLSKLKDNYPTDQATGYKANEIRGIWAIEMNKN